MNSVRKRPFGEWNIVYFDATKITSDKILKRLRENKCPKAKLIPDAVAKTKGFNVSVRNPIATPGDCFELVIATGKKHQPKVTLPDGWKPLEGPAAKKAGTWSFYVQTPAKAKEGKYAISVTRVPRKKQAGTGTGTSGTGTTSIGGPTRLSLSVELVRQVR